MSSSSVLYIPAKRTTVLQPLPAAWPAAAPTGTGAGGGARRGRAAMALLKPSHPELGERFLHEWGTFDRYGNLALLEM